MTDRIALVLACVIVTAILADIVLNSAHASVFLVRKFLDMVEYLAIWR